MQLSFAADKTAVLLCSACSREPRDGVVHNAQGCPVLVVHDEITRTDHHLQVVDSYRHLGTIAVANATPGPEIAFRAAQAKATLKPLRRRLFSAPDIPLATRRMLLRALVLSKFVYSSCSVVLQAGIHRRAWCRHYIALWRSLCRWNGVEQQPHAYTVLLRASATSPVVGGLPKHAPVTSGDCSRMGPPSFCIFSRSTGSSPREGRGSDNSTWILKQLRLVCPRCVPCWERPPRLYVSSRSFKRSPAGGSAASAGPLKSMPRRPGYLPRRLLSPLSAPSVMQHSRCANTSPSTKREPTACSAPPDTLSFSRFCFACHKWYHDLHRVQYHLKGSVALHDPSPPRHSSSLSSPGL